MKYYCGCKEIIIPDNKRPFGKGSEGEVFKIGDKLYKIYYPNAISDGYGSKENHHLYLSSIPTKKIIMPEELIYDQDGNYAGYSSSLVNGNQKDKNGIILMSSEEFLYNLELLEKDFALLSDSYVVVADISPVNYIFDKENSDMRIIDPGRYKHHIFDNKFKYITQNTAQLESLIDLLIRLDIIKYKPIDTKKKQLLIADLISSKRREFMGSLVEFFENELDGYKDVYEYAQSLNKYIR